jgi:hypothetical protein
MLAGAILVPGGGTVCAFRPLCASVIFPRSCAIGARVRGLGMTRVGLCHFPTYNQSESNPAAFCVHRSADTDLSSVISLPGVVRFSRPVFTWNWSWVASLVPSRCKSREAVSGKGLKLYARLPIALPLS